MPRRRLGVVVLLPVAEAAAVDGLRRAVGTDSRRVPPHITLVPPVNVHADDMAAALAVLRTAAQSARPFRLALGPAVSFEPVSPVLYLAVGGSLGELAALRDRVFTAPLSRPLSHPFHPHVTLGEDLAGERIAAAVTAMASFEAQMTVDRVHLLEERRLDDGRRVWRPVADAAFAPPAVVGRGGLPLELRVSEGPDPEASALWAPVAGSEVPISVTGRRDGAVVGVAAGRAHRARTVLDAVVVADGHRRQGIGRHLLAAFESAARDAGARTAVATFEEGSPLLALCRSAGWVARATLDDDAGVPLVVVARRIG